MSQNRGDPGGLEVSRQSSLQYCPSLPSYDVLIQKSRTQTALGCSSRHLSEQNPLTLPFKVFLKHPGRLQTARYISRHVSEQNSLTSVFKMSLEHLGRLQNAWCISRHVSEQNSLTLPFQVFLKHPWRLQIGGGGGGDFVRLVGDFDMLQSCTKVDCIQESALSQNGYGSLKSKAFRDALRGEALLHPRYGN
jgi:hypothetical protein